MDRIVGIGEFAISNRPEDTIKTFSLGSCIAVVIYDKIQKVAGMAHIAMPSKSLQSSNSKPCYCADTGISFLIEEMCNKYNCKKANMIIKLFGGAKSPYKIDLVLVPVM